MNNNEKHGSKLSLEGDGSVDARTTTVEGTAADDDAISAPAMANNFRESQESSPLKSTTNADEGR